MRKSIIAGLIAAVLGSLFAWADGINIPFSFPASTCTNQFIRSIAASTGVGTCATVGSSDLAANLSLTAPNIGAATATSVNFGGATLNTYTATTWTPTVVGSGTAGTGQTYSTQVGSYEQIGRQVTIRFHFLVTSYGTAAGNFLIGGLPVTPTATSGDFGSCSFGYYAVSGLAALSYGLIGYIAPSATTIVVSQNGSTGSAALTITQAGTNAEVIGVCVYHT